MKYYIMFCESDFRLQISKELFKMINIGDTVDLNILVDMYYEEEDLPSWIINKNEVIKLMNDDSALKRLWEHQKNQTVTSRELEEDFYLMIE
jgi:hypothetical protein